MSKNHVSNSAVILDDHRMFTESFAMSLERMGFFDNVEILSDEQDVYRFFRKKQTSIVSFFVDYFIPEINTLYLVADVRKLCPSVRIIIISSLVNPVLIKKVLERKPHAFLSKTSGISDLVECMGAIEENSVYLSPHIQCILDGAVIESQIGEKLSGRELEILSYIFQGKSIAQTAELLQLSRHTVATHRRNMMSKTRTRSVTELMAYATANLILPGI